MKGVALGVHFFRGEKFEGITCSEIETEVAIQTLAKHLNKEVMPVIGQKVGTLHETDAGLGGVLSVLAFLRF